MTVQCAVELEIADAVHGHGKPISLAELAAALNISPAKAPFLSRLMRMLVHMGYFVQQTKEQGEGEGRYWVTPLCRFLLKDNPFNARSFILCMNHPNMVDPWRHMSAWFRTSCPPSTTTTPFTLAHGGKKIYQVCSSDPTFGQMFAEAMGADSRVFSRALVARCKEAFEGLSSLVDVGGSTGTTAKVIAEAFPAIRCTVFDLPHVVADHGSRQAHPNLDYVGGDMFADDLPQADALLFKWVLFDWPDEPCLKVLKQCKKALTRNGGKGKLMIADHVLGHESCSDESSMGTSWLFDLAAMVNVEGYVRTEKQWAKLFSDAGFANYTISPVGALRLLIQVYP
ncbi:unnamed protein product [Linum tenue]|uniref:Uncharacterized protein n=1 Tax=Linum tenue TaxID=586396 RepID=A0AAV0GT08_9ROSI|nr:unnamed protein product [Linum tenue]